MPFLTQSRFPRLWLLMQNMIGGNPCKRALAVEYYQGQKRMLEIGCSVGNISTAFCRFADVEFTGIDIDPNAIDLAKRRFRNFPNFSFSLISLEELAQQGKIRLCAFAFEQGEFLRFRADLQHLVERSGITLHSIEDRRLGPGIVKRPFLARFNLIVREPTVML